MATVSINGKINTDWNMDFLGKTIEAPKVKTKKINIPMRDGSIDLTESLDGIAHYENREIEMRFEIRASRIEWPHLQMELANAYHGQIVSIIFDDDSDHYWTGRAYVSEIADHKSTAGITITVDAEPYRRTVAPLWKKAYDHETVEESISLGSFGHMRGYMAISNGYTPDPSGGTGTINWLRFSVIVDGEEFKVSYNSKNPNAYLPVLLQGNEITIKATVSVGLVVEIVGGDL